VIGPARGNELHIRQFDAVDLELRDDDEVGLTVTGLVVPYNVETPITEPRDDGPIRYREMFVPGAFQRAQRVPYRTTLTYDHDTSVGYRLGYGLDFTDTPEGLVGRFKLDASTAAKARDILGSSHRSFSVGFWSLNPKAFTEANGALVVRRSVHLDHVAAVAQPAYAGAGVTSFRGADPEIDEQQTDAEIAADAQQRADRQLLADLELLAAEQAKWDALRA
jgi:HK97 family phage prohead protease